MMPPKQDRGHNWSDKEILQLIAVWSDDVIQGELDGCCRNQHVFKKMAEFLKDKGFDRSWEQCRQKVKKLRQHYKQIADYQKGTGKNQKQREFKYFDHLHAFLAHRPAIRPPHLVSSSSSEDTASGETEDSFMIDDIPLTSEINQLSDGEIPASTSSSTDMVHVCIVMYAWCT